MSEDGHSDPGRGPFGTDPAFQYGLGPVPPPQPTWPHVALLLATIYTTTVAGMLMSPGLAEVDPPPGDWGVLLDLRTLVYGLPFSVTLLSILGIHEMGHYLASRRWRVRATLPYFIPFPSMIGTLGAVIKLKSRIPNRRALIDIGASGPIAGFVAAVLALGVGLNLSQVIVVQHLPEGAFSLGDSLLSAWMGRIIIGHLPEGHDVLLHPVAFGGWLGLFVTVLNLLPMGQFDGGNIVYAIFGRRHALITWATLLGLGLFWLVGPPYDWVQEPGWLSAWMGSRWPGWLIWILLGLTLGRRHPPPHDPYMELDPPRRWIGYLSLIIFLICFIPRPIQL